jgi:hypothetical protein
MTSPGKYSKLTKNADGSMSWDAGDSAQSEPPDHKCLYGNKVSEMHVILTGNGNYKSGMVAQMAEVTTKQDTIVKTLNDMDITLTSIINKDNDLLLEITEVHSKFLSFKETMKDTEERENIRQAVEATRKRDRNWRIVQVVTIILSAVGIYLGFAKLNRGQVAIKDETKITNEILVPATRGNYYDPFADTTKIK